MEIITENHNYSKYREQQIVGAQPYYTKTPELS